MKNFGSKFFLAMSVTIVSVALIGAFCFWYALKEKPVGGNFNLTASGQPWAFADAPKKINLLYIGYAKCPDVCPMTLSVAAEAFRNLKEEERKNTRLLFLSVDADHDKPADVAKYAAQFYPEFVGLSGSREQIDFTVKLFNAIYIVEENPKSYLGYSISHSDRLFFLNDKGMQVESIPIPRSSEEITKAIRSHL